VSALPAWTTSDGDRQLDLRPPGFGGFYRTLIVMVCMGLAMLLPLGILGFFGAAFFDDFPLALRVGMGLAGLSTIAACIWASTRVLVLAWATRTRMRASGEGVLVERGAVRPQQSTWLAPRSAVEVTRPGPDSWGRRAVVLTAGESSVRVGVGLRDRELGALEKAVKTMLAVEGDAASRPEPSEALGPTWKQGLRTLTKDVVHPLLHPTPYLLVDAVAIVLAPLFAHALLAFDWRDVYPFAFAAFFVGLVLRRFDGSYVEGLQHYDRTEFFWGLIYGSLALVVGGIAMFGLTPRLGLIPAAVLGVGVLVLHILMLRRAKSAAPASLPRWADYALAASLVPLSILHESAAFSAILDASGGLGPLALPMVPVAVLLGYLPVRLHAFVDNPGDRGNLAWFWITTAWLTVQPLFALGDAIASEL
jgi:hypothetical protein